jgi:DNA polymerase
MPFPVRGIRLPISCLSVRVRVSRRTFRDDLSSVGLLTRMLAAIELTREGVYITNIVKCRPPGNRNPQPDEVDSCYPYLARQIAMIEPLIIVCLGGPAAKTIIKSELGITKLRGTFHRYGVIPVLATYHPAAVLRFPEKYKRDVWNDLKLLRDFYGDLRT